MVRPLAFLVLFPSLLFAASNIWNGQADTTWFTNDKDATEYTIRTAEQLMGLVRLVNGNARNGTYDMSGKTIKLGDDIILNNTANWENWAYSSSGLRPWTPIGTTWENLFKGTFDGDGYTVSGVYINTDSYYPQGLFGLSEGTIKNLGVVASYIKGGESVGGLVGYNYGGIINNSYATGNVEGTGSYGYAGGLAGINSGTISNSYATGNVSGVDAVGGLAGSGGTIINSYATGNVSGSRYVGGLAGYGGTIINSYAIGYVEGISDVGGLAGKTSYSSIISNSYYNSETSYQYDTDKGIPMTTDDMQSEEFFETLQLGARILLANAWIYSEGEYPKLSNAIATDYFRGAGTEENPYIIETKGQLDTLSLAVSFKRSYSGKYLKLGNDIALNNTELAQWTPIGSDYSPFQGTFDGDGHVISGVYINSTNSYQGLFGVNSGTIKNLGIVASYIKGRSYVGGLVGHNLHGTIINSYVTGNVLGNSMIIGGLVGYNSEGGTITSSYATGNVSGNGNYVGGLVGYNVTGTIISCYATGNASGNENYVGGLVGSNSSAIINSYATGDVEGGYYVGGLVGDNSGTVGNSYATGKVDGTWYVGGLVGENSYGGYDGTVTYSYYNSETSYQYDTGKGIPMITDDMKSEEFVETLQLGARILSANAWIYSEGEYPKLSNAISVYSRGNGTEGDPYIIETKGQLDTFSLAVSLGQSYHRKYFKLGNDIALNDTTKNGGWQNWNVNDEDLTQWTAIGNSSTEFLGTFDGDGHVISGVYINSTSENQGLFGHLGNTTIIGTDATIKNLGVTASYIKGGSNVGGLAGFNLYGTIINSYVTGNVTGSGYYVGGLAGENYGTISDSYVTGNVVGSNGVGGLVGGNIRGTISNSYTTGNVKGSSAVGGLAGNNDEGSGIINSYATGNVEGYQYIGGLVGSNYSYGTTIINSYATGNVEGSSSTGGLAGNNGYNSTIINSYAIGNVGGGYNTGGLVGYNDDDATIINSYATGNVEGSGNYVGGLAGRNSSTINDSYATGDVEGSGDYVGGLAGSNDGDLTGSYAIGDVEGSGDYVGGLAGSNSSTIGNSYATGNVLGGSSTGGLAGSNDGTIAGSYATGNVEGMGYYAGGLVGNNINTIGNSYAIGNVSGAERVGGLAGYNFGGTISNSYAIGNVDGNNSVGGLVGYNQNGSITNSYYNTQTSGLNDTGKGEGRSTAQMRSKSSYVTGGWDFDLLWDIDGKFNNGMPYFQWRNNMELVQVEPIGSRLYTGYPIKPTPKVTTPDGIELISEIDFDYLYEENLANGGTVYIVGKPNARYYGTKTVPFTIRPVKNVYVNWNTQCGSSAIFTYNGEPQGPTPSSTTAGYEALITTDLQTNAGGYTASARLITPEDDVVLQNPSCDYTIAPKPLEVTWTAEREFVYSKMNQSPIPSVDENELADEIDFALLNANSEAGEYKGDNAALYIVNPSDPNAGNYILQNNRAEYTITKKPLEIDIDADEISLDMSYIDNIESIQAYLRNLVTYSGFATNTETGESDNPSSALSGSPDISVSELEGELETHDGFVWKKYSVNIDASMVSAKNYLPTTSGNIYIIPVSSAALVPVTWGSTVTFIYDGTEQAPTATAGGVEIEVIGKQTNAGGYTATARLKTPNDRVFLQNENMPYTITKKQLEVSWTPEREFVYNKMIQFPTPSVDEPDVELRVSNTYSEVGEYTAANLLAPYALIISPNAGNYELLNNSVDYAITKKPLEIGIDGADEISLDMSYIDNIESILAYLRNLVTYSGFATNTETGESDNPSSALSGSPDISISELEELDTLGGFIRKKYSVNIDASTVSAKNYIPTTSGNIYIIPVSSAALVPVIWDNTVTFVYDGTEHAPTATAGDFEIEIYGGRINAGGYTATARLKTPNDRVFLQNEDMPYTITKKQIEVSWTPEREFVYNKMTQGPIPSIDEPGVELRATNIYSGVGEYTAENKLAPYATIISANADNYELLNNSVDYVILPKPLKPYFSTALPAFEYNTDTLWVPSEVFTDSAALQKILEQVIYYDGFATDDKGDSDDASVLRGAPIVSIEYAASPSMLSKRVETSQKATATIVTNNVSADNYILLTRPNIVIMETIEDEEEAEKINCYRVSYCTEISREVCLFIEGEPVESCSALRKSCLIDDRCVDDLLIGECTGIGGETLETTCAEVPTQRPKISNNTFRIWQTASGVINVDLGYMPATPVKLQIYDLKGKLVSTEQVNTRFANIKVNMPSGVYLFRAGNRVLRAAVL